MICSIMRRKMARDGGSYSNVKLLALSHKVFLNILATYGRGLCALRQKVLRIAENWIERDGMLKFAHGVCPH